MCHHRQFKSISQLLGNGNLKLPIISLWILLLSEACITIFLYPTLMFQYHDDAAQSSFFMMHHGICYNLKSILSYQASIGTFYTICHNWFHQMFLVGQINYNILWAHCHYIFIAQSYHYHTIFYHCYTIKQLIWF